MPMTWCLRLLADQRDMPTSFAAVTTCVSALNDDAAAAIAAALSKMPIETIDFQTVIVMTALLRCAFDDDAAAAPILAQIAGLIHFGHSLSGELSVSWLG
jgi:hypothetical protein